MNTPTNRRLNPLYLKIAGALDLLQSLALPISLYEGGHAHPVTDEVLFEVYFLTGVGPDDWFAFFVIVSVFVWPVLTIAALLWRNAGKFAAAVRMLEILGIAYSSFVVGLYLYLADLNFFDPDFVPPETGLGIYAAFAGLAIYGLGALWSDWYAFQRWRQNRAGTA